MRRPRLTVKAKVYAGLAMLVVFGVLSMLYIHRGLGDVSRHLNQLDQVEVPFSTAAFEMELNSEEYALEVIKYIARPNPEHRAEARDDSADFVRYQRAYLRLSRGAREQALGRQAGLMHRQLVAMGEAMMLEKDRQERVFESVTRLLEDVDRIADDQLPQLVPAQEPLRSRLLTMILDIEAETAEIGFWLATYSRQPTPQARQEVSEKVAELGGAIAQYQTMPLDPQSRRLSRRLRQDHEEVARTIGVLLTQEDNISEMMESFISHQDAIDDLVDEEVQALALTRLAEPRRQADEAALQVREVLRYLIPFYVVVALVVGALLIATIVRPLRRLAEGTRAIGQGELGHRIDETGDEFGDLARQFNRMVVRLQETLVSKSELEVSDRNLRHSLAELRQQIEERERSEREQEKLRGELRRREAMATIGELMACVAHEVRNPLFGISSALDAMEAQPDVPGVHARYRGVLRREAGRLNKLMRDLLEYGRLSSDNFVQGRLGRVVDEAVRICAPTAEAAGVSIDNLVRPGEARVHMDQGRLLQVFVNLIDNALQHAPAGSAVTVRTACVEDTQGRPWVECTVRDAGSGFAPEDLPLVFNPFFTRRRGGTGLGLSIVQRIVDEHRGRISAGNHAEGGAVVTVCLPLDVQASGDAGDA
jgi:signal transduction histidine kinase